MARTIPLLRTAGLVVLAYVTSQLIYWHLVVPKLPELHSVPITWWIVVYLPFAVAAIAARTLVSSARRIPSDVLVAALVPALAPAMSALVTGAPIAHDVDLRDLIQPSYIVFLACLFLAMCTMFGGAIILGYGISRRPVARP